LSVEDEIIAGHARPLSRSPSNSTPFCFAEPHRGKQEACQRGFTLVELIIVLGIAMTVSAIAIPPFLQTRDTANYAKAVGDITLLEIDIATYVGFNGTLPDTLTVLKHGYLVDPWGNPYIYTNYADVTKQNQIRKDRFIHPLNSSYDLFSAGKDGQWKAPITAADSRDDIIRANDGAYVGLASDY
jgi:general secretion pathway protein G